MSDWVSTESPATYKALDGNTYDHQSQTYLKQMAPILGTSIYGCERGENVCLRMGAQGMTAGSETGLGRHPLRPAEKNEAGGSHRYDAGH